METTANVLYWLGRLEGAGFFILLVLYMNAYRNYKRSLQKPFGQGGLEPISKGSEQEKQLKRVAGANWKWVVAWFVVRIANVAYYNWLNNMEVITAQVFTFYNLMLGYYAFAMGSVIVFGYFVWRKTNRIKLYTNQRWSLNKRKKFKSNAVKNTFGLFSQIGQSVDEAKKNVQNSVDQWIGAE
ncbi:hypothetical protein [Schleiferilactobacillus perolens]|uniref:hypothetical protein n=1 Tax=Schleiferilactobacillus perolens TaxID=100468 RepID=UPI0039EA3CEB